MLPPPRLVPKNVVTPAAPSAPAAPASRKPYTPPRLVEIGKLGLQTLGKSGPGTDSNRTRQTQAP